MQAQSVFIPKGNGGGGGGFNVKGTVSTLDETPATIAIYLPVGDPVDIVIWGAIVAGRLPPGPVPGERKIWTFRLLASRIGGSVGVDAMTSEPLQNIPAGSFAGVILPWDIDAVPAAGPGVAIQVIGDAVGGGRSIKWSLCAFAQEVVE